MMLCAVCLDEHNAGHLWPTLGPEMWTHCGDCGHHRLCVRAPRELVERITRKDGR